MHGGGSCWSCLRVTGGFDTGPPHMNGPGDGGAAGATAEAGMADGQIGGGPASYWLQYCICLSGEIPWIPG